MITLDHFSMWKMLGIEVVFSQTLVAPCTFLELDHDRTGVPRRVVFHSSAIFHLYLHGATWHDQRQHCPTWSDATECRCDVEA